MSNICCSGVDRWLMMLFCSQPQVGDVFIGYHADTAASITLQVCQLYNTDDGLPVEQVLVLLINCTVYDSLFGSSLHL